jgi:signal transduction histidine kinase
MARPLRLALLPLGIVFGLIAESEAAGGSWPRLTAADFVVGCVLIASGVIAWDRRPESRAGALLALAGFTWFLGTLWDRALYLHRGPLVHVVLSYPAGRLRTRFALVVVIAAYVDGAIRPLAANAWVTVALGGLVTVAAVGLFLGTSGPARRAAARSLGAALAFAAILSLSAFQQLAAWNGRDPVLWAYDVVVAAIAIVLAVDLLRGRWREAVVTSLVVDLGAQTQVGTLRAKLAGALGDPTLVVGYRLPETGSFVDDAGRAVEVRSPGPSRTVTAIDDHGERIAVLIHDDAVLADPELVKSIAAAARLAVGNARLQAEAQARAADLEASRRRIVEAAATQRQRLEAQLRLGAERRLDSVAALLAEARKGAAVGDRITALEDALDETRRELREFAQGVHPAVLSEAGLFPALEQLADRLPLAVDVRGGAGRLPAPVEAALYFVCSEALANAAKHADASHVTIDVREERGQVVVTVADNGDGGAEVSRGTGLRGLADRVEALGGSFQVESSVGAGTRVVAAIASDNRVQMCRS